MVSRATLWVNGEEREAAYGGRGEVRAAYQQVAVQQRRDPLLVTTKGADRVLAQAFPVPRNGGTIKFKLGISAPLEITPSRQGAPDAAGGRSIATSRSAPTQATASGSKPAGAGHGSSGLAASEVDGRLFRISGTLDDRDAVGHAAVDHGRSQPSAEQPRSRASAMAKPIVQEIMRAASRHAALMLVIDGSARLAGHGHEDHRGARCDSSRHQGRRHDRRRADRAHPVGAMVRRAEELRRSSSSARRRSAGGQDNCSGARRCAATLEAEPQATLLWIHGPQPISFSGSAARLEQATARLTRLPEVVLYSVEAGPNEVLPDAPWAWGARSLPQTGAPDVDLAGFLVRSTGREPGDPPRSRNRQPMACAAGSDHIARLWANERVLELMRSRSDDRAAAVALATPLSFGDAGERCGRARNQAAIRRRRSSTPVEPGDRADRSRAARMGADHDRLRGADVD